MSDRLPADRSQDPNLRHVLPAAPDRPGEGHRLVVLDRSNPEAPEWAAERLVNGGVVAFPTDTVYGIAASLAQGEAVRRLYAVNGRPEDNPIPVLLASATDLDQIALDADPRLLLLAARFWPGPLTVVVPAREGLPPEVVGPGGTVGARVPNPPLALRLLEAAGGAAAVTSANRSGEPPARTAAEAEAALGADLDLLLDGGPTPGGVPSTVVALEVDDLRVLREGAIPPDELAASWADLRTEHDLRDGFWPREDG